jgi:hypothetical protein
MPIAGRATAVKVSGASTAMTGEATTGNYRGNPKAFQVTNAAKQILDPDAAVVVKDGGTPIAASGYTVNYLFGVVTLVSTPGGAVTIDASYIPTLTLAEARKVDWSRTCKLLEKTVFGNAEVRRTPGLVDCEGSLEGLAPVTDDLDAGVGGEQSLDSFFTAGTPKLIEVSFTGTTRKFRAWALLEQLDEASSFDELVTHPVKWKGISKTGAGRTDCANFGWGI